MTSVAKGIAILVIGFVIFFPILWVLMTSFKTYADAFSYPPLFWFRPTLQNYAEVLQKAGITRYLGNSILIAVVSTFVSITVGAISAYALTRYRLRGADAVAFLMLATRFVPPVATVLPLFLIARRAGLYDTCWILVLTTTAMNVPYAIWMMRGFYRELPPEVEEAAMIDGCSRLGAFFRVVVPLSGPGLAATSVLAMIFTWNEFFYALILTGSRARTLPLFISGYIGETGIEWTQMAASATVVMIPALLLSVFVQRQLARGLTFGLARK